MEKALLANFRALEKYGFKHATQELSALGSDNLSEDGAVSFL